VTVAVAVGLRGPLFRGEEAFDGKQEEPGGKSKESARQRPGFRF
jgi:hypothetical protein